MSLFGLLVYILIVYKCKIQNIKLTLVSNLSLELDASSYDIQNRKQQLLSISYCFRDIRLQTLKKGDEKSKNKQQILE